MVNGTVKNLHVDVDIDCKMRLVGGTNASAIGGGHTSINSPVYGVCGDIVINGGQVTAQGSEKAPGIGPSQTGVDAVNSGTLTLGWTNIDDFLDFKKSANWMFLSTYAKLKSITFALGRQFVLDGTSTIATADNIEGHKIVPSLSLSGAGTEASP